MLARAPHEQARRLGKPVQRVAVRVTEHLQGAVHAIGGGVIHRSGLAKPRLGVPLLLLGDEPGLKDVGHVDRAGAAQVNLSKSLGDLLVESLP